ncbi:MAG: type II secretion system protein GspN [Deltaproteobacteria bacterium]|nr:type II secretion system protein GspN [Deltaproteobacteria bacterium]
MKRFLKNALFTLFGILVFAGVLALTIPAEFISDETRNWLKRYNGIIITENGVKKIFPFGIEIKHAVVSYSGEDKHFLALDTLKARLSIIYLLTGRIRVLVEGNKEDGTIKGYILSRVSNTTINLTAENMDIYIHSTTEGNFSGRLNIDFKDGRCPEGNIDIEGKDIVMRWLHTSGISIPLGKGIKGNLHAKSNGCRIDIKVLHLENENITVNAHGNISLKNPYLKSYVDVDIEVIPSLKSIKDGNYILSLISNYRKSSNYYSMKVKGILENPILYQ